VLRQVGGVVGGRHGAAARLGLARTTLIHRMRRLGITQEKAAAAGAGGDGWSSPASPAHTADAGLRNPLEPAWL